MKKNVSYILGFTLLLFLQQKLYAQDIITLKTGDDLKAKVVEIGSTEIKYKKFENLDGPTYTLSKGEVFMVKYQNGSKDVFNVQMNSTPSDNKNETTQPPKKGNEPNVTKSGNKQPNQILKYGIYKGKFGLYDKDNSPINKNLSKIEMLELLKSDPTPLDYYQKHYKLKKTAMILSYSGAGAVLLGAGLMIGGVVPVLVDALNADFNYGLLIGGGVLIGAGLGVAIASVPLSIRSSVYGYKAAGAYNKKMKEEAYLSIRINSGLGLALQF